MFEFEDDTVRAGELLDGEDEGERFHPAYAFDVQATDEGLPRLMVLGAERNEPYPLVAFDFLTEAQTIEGGMRTRRYHPSVAGDDPEQMICRARIVGNPGEWAYFLARYADSLGFRFGPDEYEEAVRNLQHEALSLFERLPDLNRKAMVHREKWGGPMLIMSAPHD